MKHRRRIIVAGSLAAVVAGALVYLFVDFTPPPPPRDVAAIVDHAFPSVSQKDLTGAVQHLPGDLEGSPAIILVTPSKKSQPDADKWIETLRAREGLQFRETPIITSKVAHLMQGFIKGKMRGGLPTDMWPRVIPLFDDGGRLLNFFGAYDDALTWVVVLDNRGIVRWFSVKEYTADLAAEAINKYASLK